MLAQFGNGGNYDWVATGQIATMEGGQNGAIMSFAHFIGDRFPFEYISYKIVSFFQRWSVRLVIAPL